MSVPSETDDGCQPVTKYPETNKKSIDDSSNNGNDIDHWIVVWPTEPYDSEKHSTMHAARQAARREEGIQYNDITNSTLARNDDIVALIGR